MERLATQRLATQIHNRYPEAKIAYFNKIANGQIDFDTLLLLLDKMRLDKNRFMIIEKIDKKQFYKFAESLLELKVQGKDIHFYNFILIRGQKTAIMPNDPKDIEFILKQTLNDIHNECSICCNDFQIDENRFFLLCGNSTCLICAQKRFDTTLFWCPD